jgi:hypothetical protein
MYFSGSWALAPFFLAATVYFRLLKGSTGVTKYLNRKIFLYGSPPGLFFSQIFISRHLVCYIKPFSVKNLPFGLFKGNNF